MKFLALPDQAKDYTDILQEIVSKRVKANRLKDEAKLIEEEANGLFLGLTQLAGFEAVETDKGTIRVVHKTGADRLDQAKLKDNLIKAGVDSDIVLSSFKKATTKGAESTYVGFFPPKGE
jgi:hypothetical protein